LSNLLGTSYSSHWTNTSHIPSNHFLPFEVVTIRIACFLDD
jgi:hypothetical protein